MLLEVDPAAFQPDRLRENSGWRLSFRATLVPRWLRCLQVTGRDSKSGSEAFVVSAARRGYPLADESVTGRSARSHPRPTSHLRATSSGATFARWMPALRVPRRPTSAYPASGRLTAHPASGRLTVSPALGRLTCGSLASRSLAWLASRSLASLASRSLRWLVSGPPASRPSGPLASGPVASGPVASGLLASGLLVSGPVGSGLLASALLVLGPPASVCPPLGLLTSASLPSATGVRATVQPLSPVASLHSPLIPWPQSAHRPRQRASSSPAASHPLAFVRRRAALPVVAPPVWPTLHLLDRRDRQ